MLQEERCNGLVSMHDLHMYSHHPSRPTTLSADLVQRSPHLQYGIVVQCIITTIEDGKPMTVACFHARSTSSSRWADGYAVLVMLSAVMSLWSALCSPAILFTKSTASTRTLDSLSALPNDV